MSEQKRSALIDACRRVNSEGLNRGSSGNASLRDGDTMLVTPSAMAYEKMRPQDIVALDLRSASPELPADPRPSSEWRMHFDVLRARPEVGAVLHLHPIAATAVAALRRDLPPFHYMVAVAGGHDIRCAPYHRYGTPALSAAVVAALEGRRACLMANHGLLTTGRDLDQAHALAVEIEALCAQYLAACSAGEPVLLSGPEMDAVLAGFAEYHRH